MWPLVFLKPKNPSLELINHEKIHIRQQSEMLVLFFYLWYFIEFVIHYMSSFNWDIAYNSISFEKEAYHHQNDLEYLKNRKFWAFIRYL